MKLRFLRLPLVKSDPVTWREFQRFVPSSQDRIETYLVNPLSTLGGWSTPSGKPVVLQDNKSQVHEVVRKSFNPHRGKAEALRIRKLPRRFEYQQSLRIEARVNSTSKDQRDGQLSS